VDGPAAANGIGSGRVCTDTIRRASRAPADVEGPVTPSGSAMVNCTS
jgi:hypothetical protein